MSHEFGWNQKQQRKLGSEQRSCDLHPSSLSPVVTDSWECEWEGGKNIKTKRELDPGVRPVRSVEATRPHVCL